MSKLANPNIEIESSLITRAMWASGIFMAAHLVSGLLGHYSVWGLDFLRFYPLWCWGVFGVFGLLLLVPPSRSVFVELAKRLSGSFSWPQRFGVFLMALAVFYFFQVETHLLGDGDLLIRDMNAMGPNGTSRAFFRSPLVLTLIRFFDAQHAVSPLVMYRFYSWISGALYLLVCFKTAKDLGATTAETGLLFGALVTPGFVQLFFGYVENYALIFPVILGYLLSSYRALTQKGSLLLPIGLLGLLIPIHFMTVSLFPSFLVLLYYTTFSAPSGITLLQRLVKAAFVFCLPIILVFVILISISFDIVSYLQSSKSHMLALFPSAGQYGVFSFVHFFDLVNLYLLIAPFAWMALVVIPLRTLLQPKPEHVFLGVASVFPMGLSVVFNPEIGFFRDWDALSMVSLPMTMWLAVLVIAQVRQPKMLWHIGTLCVGASALHTALWIGVNASEARSVARYDHVLRTHTLPAMAHAWSWETLGVYYLKREEFTLARDAYLQAIDKNPGNGRFLNAVGVTHLRMGEMDLALPYFQRALKKNPHLAEAEANIGSVYFSKKEYDDAKRHYASAIQIKPNFPGAHVQLGQVHYLQGHLDLSIRHYEAAVLSDSKNVAAWHGLGIGYFERGAFDAATRAFRQVVLLQPDHAEAVFNLALCFDREGMPDSSAIYRSRAAALDPGRFSNFVHSDIDSLTR